MFLFFIKENTQYKVNLLKIESCSIYDCGEIILNSITLINLKQDSEDGLKHR